MVLGTHCTALVEGKREIISVEAALDGKGEDYRCLRRNCKAPVRPFRKGRDGRAAHFQHLKANEKCPDLGQGLIEKWGQELESEAEADIEQTLQSAIERAAGFQSNPRIRRAIEMYAMKWAKARLKKLADELEDTHKTKSYDFLCSVSGKELFVEVKGTQDDGNSVSLSPKEVEHALNHSNSALFIVHSVKVKGKRNPVVSGGKERFLNPWDISTGTLKERGFIYTLSKNP